MNKIAYRIKLLIVYLIIGVSVICAAFLFSKDASTKYEEPSIDVNDGWLLNGELISLPCTVRDKVVLERTLPEISDKQILLVQCFYKDASVYINDKLVYVSQPCYFLGHETNVGHNELKIPIMPFDSGGTIRIEINVQNSIYSRRISDAIIYSTSGYVSHIIIHNLFSLSLVSTFFISGLVEIVAAIYYLCKRIRSKTQYSFLALLFTGVFSVTASIWVTCETMVLQALFGHPTAFAIINDVIFMLMPLAFLALLRALVGEDRLHETIMVNVIGIVIIISILLCLFGIFDWNLTEYVGHILVFIVFVHVIRLSMESTKKEKNNVTRKSVAIGNLIFVAFSAIGLTSYMLGISNNYLAIVIAGLMSYAYVQVFLVFQRVGLSVDEEEEFVTVTHYAYNDELTGLGNRRYFFNKIDQYLYGQAPDDLTLISIDANRLKYYNDNFGHGAGDELLKGVADSIKKTFTDDNTLAICRMGGDEFLVAIVEDSAITMERIENLRKELASFKGEFVSDLSAAIGFAQVKEYPDYSFEQLFKVADDRMYEDKQRYYESSGIDRRTHNIR